MKDLSSVYRLHEIAKKREYGDRICEVERGAFIPLVLSTTGGMARECTVFYKRLADCLADKRKQPTPCDDLVEMLNLFCTTEVCHQGFTGISKLHHCSGSSGYTIGFQ